MALGLRSYNRPQVAVQGYLWAFDERSNCQPRTGSAAVHHGMRHGLRSKDYREKDLVP